MTDVTPHSRPSELRPPQQVLLHFCPLSSATSQALSSYTGFLTNEKKTHNTQQFTYGVVWEGVTAEKIPRISAKFLQTFRRTSAPFPAAIKRVFREISAKFPQTFRKKPFANDPKSLRSRPPFTRVLGDPGWKVPHGVLFECFWALASECPKECFLSAFWHFQGTLRQVPKSTQKALRGALSSPGP